MNQAELLRKLEWRPELDEEEKKEKPSQAQMLIEIAKAKCVLYRGCDDKVYANLNVDFHYENWELGSKFFKNWLIKEHYEQKEKPPSQSAVTDAINALEGLTYFNKSIAQKDVFMRIGGNFNEIYIDLCNDTWEAIKITSNGWEVVAKPSIMFRRRKAMRPLPKPIKGGDINLLKKYVSCRGNDFILFVLWLVGTFSPESPYPLLILQGTQGSGKSTFAKIVKHLIDPSSAPIRSTPKNEQDLMIQANNSWLLAFDNLSGLQPWLSDALCKLATGGGFSTRELYSNDEETIFTATRPTILNGIDDVATRGDLADRSIMINLPSISEQDRRSEQDFWQEFKKDSPYILGAILDIVSACLRNRKQVKLDGLPRMADFAIWATAGEQAAGFAQGAFMKAYQKNKQESIEVTLQNDLFTAALVKFMADKHEWTGTAEELLNQELPYFVNELERKSKYYPKSNKLKTKLNRFKIQLESVGIKFEHKKSNKGAIYTIQNTKT